MQCRASRQQAVARAAPSGGSLRGGSLPPDLVQPPLQTELIEAGYRQRGECRDALMQHAVGVLEGKRDLGVAAGRFRRIWNAPMRGHRLARPYRAGFTGCVVANRKDEIQLRRGGLREHAPGLRPVAGRVVTERLEQLQRVRVHLSLRLRSGAVGSEFSRADLLFSIASARIERAELRVQRKRTL